MKAYTAMVVQNLIACLLIGASLHGCSEGHAVWGWGVALATQILVKPKAKECDCAGMPSDQKGSR